MDEGQCTVLLLLLPNLPSNFQHFLFPRGQGRSRGKYKGSQVPRSSSPNDWNFFVTREKVASVQEGLYYEVIFPAMDSKNLE